MEQCCNYYLACQFCVAYHGQSQTRCSNVLGLCHSDGATYQRRLISNPCHWMDALEYDINISIYDLATDIQPFPMEDIYINVKLIAVTRCYYNVRQVGLYLRNANSAMQCSLVIADKV